MRETPKASPAPDLQAALRQAAGRSGTAAQRHADAAGLASAAGIMQLQRTLGNRALGRLMTGVAQRNPANSPKLPASMPAAKAAVVSSLMGAHLRDFDKQTDPASGAETFTVAADKMIGDKISFRGEMVVYNVADTTGAWTLAQYKGKFGFIRANKVGPPRGLSGARDKLLDLRAQQAPNTKMQDIGAAPTDESDAFEDTAENIEETTEVAMSGPGGVSDSLEMQIDALDGVAGQEDAKEALELEKSKVGMATAPADMLTSTVGGLVAMKKIISTAKDTEKSKTEKGFDITEGVIDVAGSLQGGVESTSGFIDDVGNLAGSDAVETAGDVSDWSGSVGEAIAAIKSSFFMVKNIYELFQKTFSSEGVSADEVVSAGLEVVSNGLQVAQSAVKTVKSILDILKVGAAGLAQAIPGLGIAISGITITIKVYNMIKSSIASYRMTKAKRKFKADYANKDYVGAKQYTLFGRNLWKSFNPGTDTAKLEQRKQDLIALGSAASDEEKKEHADIQEYELAKEMKLINKKRILRGTMQVGLEMVNIAGEIATLSGVGAKVGVPLKAVAAGAGVSMSIARKIKQFGRDRAAKPGAWRATKAVFDAEKSSAKKLEKRTKHSNLILEMIANLPEYRPDDAEIVKQYQRVENFISASGINPRALYRLNGNMEKQRELLVNGMKKRE